MTLQQKPDFIIMTTHNIEDIVKNIKNIPILIAKSKDILSKIHIYAESGAGLVKVKMDGRKILLKVRIDKSLMKEDKFIIEDLVTEAINNANRKVDIEVHKKMVVFMDEMGIPQQIISMLPFIGSK